MAGLVAALILVSAGFLLGAAWDVGGSVGAIFSDHGGSAGYELQQEVLDKLESSYYRDFDAEALKVDAIDGMVAGLDDPYTVYMDPEEYASFNEQTKGSYSGVGMTVEMKNRLVTIVSTFKGSPAQLAGVRSGDLILKVDGVTTDGLKLDEVVAKIKGAEGTSVVLELYRPPATTTTSTPSDAGGEGRSTEGVTANSSQLPPGGATKDYTLVRKAIAVPVTERETLEVEGRTAALIHFFTFSDNSAEELRGQVKKAIETDGVDAIILDLRSNGGGLLDEAVSAASVFIPGGVIVTTEGLHSPEEVYSAEGGAYSDIPLYVLTDPYTASASEILAGALQDHDRALVIGETTFGKGLVQILSPLSNGGAVKLTSAVYLTPDGRDINQTGIAPDVTASDDLTTTDVDECVEAALDSIASDSAQE